MKLSFVTIGRFKSAECEALVERYLKLIGRFDTVERVELKEPRGEPADIDSPFLQWLEKRGARAHLTLLDERGKAFTSRAFAAALEEIRQGSYSEWIVAVGSARGYGDAVRSRARLLWSLSPMTMPHELAAAVAAEQIFRAHSILARHPYHNE